MSVITIAGKEYPIVGQKQDAPYGLFKIARMLERKSAAGEELTSDDIMEFFDLVDILLVFLIGAEQYRNAKEDIYAAQAFDLVEQLAKVLPKYAPQ